MSEDLVLVPEVEARRALDGRAIRLQVLAPLGSWIGRGTLRVLRVKISESDVEMIVGYEAYAP